MKSALKEVQAERQVTDPWESVIKDGLEERFKRTGEKRKIELWEVGKDIFDMTSGEIDHQVQKRIASCMRAVGWMKGKPSNGKNYWIPNPEFEAKKAAIVRAAPDRVTNEEYDAILRELDNE